MTETEMRKTLKRVGKEAGISFYALETKGATLGLADLLFSGRGTGGVVELKVLSGKNAAKIPYRAGQRVFLREHAAGNPRTFVLAWWPERKAFFLIDSRDGFPAQYGLSTTSLMVKARWAGREIDRSLLDELVR